MYLIISLANLIRRTGCQDQIIDGVLLQATVYLSITRPGVLHNGVKAQYRRQNRLELESEMAWMG